MLHLLKNYLRETLFYDFLIDYRQKKDLKRWRMKGKLDVTPHLIKKDAVLHYSCEFNTDIFVETGTFIWEKVKSVSGHFKKSISIELSMQLAQRASKKFAAFHHIQIINGDSALVLADILPSLYGKKPPEICRNLMKRAAAFKASSFLSLYSV